MLKRARVLLVEYEQGMYFPFGKRIYDDRRTPESYAETDVLSHYRRELRSTFQTGTTRQTNTPAWSQRICPTHFISLRLPPNNVLTGRVKKMHEAMCFTNPEYEKLLIPLPRLHVTLGVLSLPEETAPTQLRELCACVEQACRETCKQPLQLSFRGLGTFNYNSVLFIRCIAEKHYTTLDNLVCKIRREAGIGLKIDMKGNPFDSYVPHITVAKIRPKHISELGREIPLSCYAEFQHNEFGDVVFDTVDICNMHGSDTNGYYKVEASTSLNF